jgi:hypothetical protein
MHFWVKDILSVTSGFCHTKYDMIYIKDAITGKYFWDVLNKVRKDYGCWSVQEWGFGLFACSHQRYYIYTN